MKFGIVICSRSKSSRIYKKPLQRLGMQNKTIIEHLVETLEPLKIPIVLAIPREDKNDFEEIIEKMESRIAFFYGHKNDPLARMHDAAQLYDFDHVIRVTHDKLFLDVPLIKHAIDRYLEGAFQYLYSNQFIEGSGFEIIDYQVLEKATKAYENVEHISYAIRLLTDKILNLNLIGTEFSYHPSCPHRFLIDYPEDIFLMNELFIKFEKYTNLKNSIKFLDENPSFSLINKLPLVTFYTCAKDGEEYLDECMASVIKQSVFKKSEYIIVNDYSKDTTFNIASKYKRKHSNIKILSNYSNKGLAYSSNIALKHARGKYIIRLDHDDYFTDKHAVRDMIKEMNRSFADVVYPAYHDEESGEKVDGKVRHHIGGTLFLTKSINYIKFTEKLRNFEGLDFFYRAKTLLDLAYYDREVFFYRHVESSMSHTNKRKRDKIKKEIEGKYES